MPKLRMLAAFAILATASPASAQGLPAQGSVFISPMIAGVVVGCGGIPLVVDYTLPDGAHTTITPRGPIIIWNPNVMLRYPPSVELFVYAHECGHQVLQTSTETRADCWAAQIGRRQGWFGRADLVALGTTMLSPFNPGDFTHPPGPVRMNHIVECYDNLAMAP